MDVTGTSQVWTIDEDSGRLVYSRNGDTPS